jgi:transposase
MHKKEIPSEALLELRRRLEQLPSRSEIRPQLISETAQLYGVSKGTVYRALRSYTKPKGVRRAD